MDLAFASASSAPHDTAIRFTQPVCRNFPEAIEREWIETNGLGGFASSTIVGANTRRYHGLLVAAIKPPLGRMVFLSKLEETVVIRGSRFELSSNQYPGVVHPEGYEYLEEFRLDPFPIFIYRLGDIVIEKVVFMVWGQNTTVVIYRVLSAPGYVELILRPLVAFREYHLLQQERPEFNPRMERQEELWKIRPFDGLPILYLTHNADQVEPAGYWYKNFEYVREKERGLDFQEDLFSHGQLIYLLKEGERAYVVASIEGRKPFSVEVLESSQVLRRSQLTSHLPKPSPFVHQLALVADSFVIRRPDDHLTVVAGYHWFWDWGRDALIALPGLLLLTGRTEDARKLLSTFAHFCDQGMIPNRFPEQGQEPEYNTVDAALWFIYAVYQYAVTTRDLKFIEETLVDVMMEIIGYYINGTRYDIIMDDDGLIQHGDSGLQLTWMDAKVDDVVITPRSGKAVEVNALWYTALRVMEYFTEQFHLRLKKDYAKLAQGVKVSFSRTFWHDDGGYLFDCVSGSERNAQIRPNQILAVSLPFELLPKDRQRKVLNVVQEHLLTPYGLRTLSPRDPGYRPQYVGNQKARDAAYHQGTVWPWLLGPFLTAYLNVHGRAAPAKEQAAQWLAPFRQHLQDAGLGTISEIFDGDPPHAPRGCISQAFSVAELLRVALEEELL